MTDVKGLTGVKRTLEIAAAGGHSLLIMGPSGCGKTMLGRWLDDLLPSQAGGHRPFRAPPFYASVTAMVGRYDPPEPGEIVGANNGVLFLDDLQMFAPTVLAAIYRALDAGGVEIETSNGWTMRPSRFLLAGTMTADPTSPKVSRIIDRFDLLTELASPLTADLALPMKVDELARSSARVRQARDRQTSRYGVSDSQRLNAHASLDQLEDLGRPDEASRRLLYDHGESKVLTARQWLRTLAIARTIADLDGSLGIERLHMVEAIVSIATTLPEGDVRLTEPS